MNPYSSHLDWIDTQEAELLRRVKHLVSINTFSLHIAGLEELAALLQSSFSQLGGQCSTLKLPPQKALGKDGKFHLQTLGPALSFKKRPEAPLQVLLAGHFDTVYPPASGGHEAQEMVPGIWKGQGIADMKGGIAIMQTALEALERSPFADRLGWEVLLTPDEEIGSPGSASLYESAACRNTCGLVFEPSFPDGAFVSERKGSTVFTVQVLGKAAHVGRDYSKGRSAVFPLARLIQKLESFRADADMIVNVADLEGKGPVNIIAPLASCRINLRSSVENKLEKSIALLRQYCEECQEEGIQIEVSQDTYRPPKVLDRRTDDLFEAYGACAHDLHLPFKTRPSGGVCDGNILSGAGLPTLDTAGAVGGSLHTPDEYLICSSLRERSKLAALFLLKLASGEIALKKEEMHGSG